jgi:hypothetical protein
VHPTGNAGRCVIPFQSASVEVERIDSRSRPCISKLSNASPSEEHWCPLHNVLNPAYSAMMDELLTASGITIERGHMCFMNLLRRECTAWVSGRPSDVVPERFTQCAIASVLFPRLPSFNSNPIISNISDKTSAF